MMTIDCIITHTAFRPNQSANYTEIVVKLDKDDKQTTITIE